MKPARIIPETCRATASDVRPWRVVTHQVEACTVQTFSAYELALHTYRAGLAALPRAAAVAVELRDPSGRELLHSSDTPRCRRFAQVNDGLIDAQDGRYLWNDRTERFHRCG